MVCATLWVFLVFFICFMGYCGLFVLVISGGELVIGEKGSSYLLLLLFIYYYYYYYWVVAL